VALTCTSLAARLPLRNKAGKFCGANRVVERGAGGVLQVAPKHLLFSNDLIGQSDACGLCAR